MARREVISKVEAHGDVEKVGVKVGQTFLSALLIVLLPEYRQACAGYTRGIAAYRSGLIGDAIRVI